MFLITGKRAWTKPCTDTDVEEQPRQFSSLQRSGLLAAEDVGVTSVGDDHDGHAEELTAGGTQGGVVARVVVHAGAGEHGVVLDLGLLQRGAVVGDEDHLGSARAEGADGLLGAEHVLATAHDQLELGVDVLNSGLDLRHGESRGWGEKKRKEKKGKTTASRTGAHSTESQQEAPNTTATGHKAQGTEKKEQEAHATKEEKKKQGLRGMFRTLTERAHRATRYPSELHVARTKNTHTPHAPTRTAPHTSATAGVTCKRCSLVSGGGGAACGQ